MKFSGKLILYLCHLKRRWVGGELGCTQIHKLKNSTYIHTCGWVTYKILNCSGQQSM
jgi:hypothetical protein